MIHYEIVRATRAHAEELALTMRPQDIEEVAAQGYTPLEALLISVEDSTAAYAGLADGKVLGIFGYTCRSLLSDEAFPWLLTCRDIHKHSRWFMGVCREFIAGMRQRYRLLWGWVCETNTISIRWLTWLGFTIEKDVRYHAPGKPGFRYFHLET